MNKHFFLILCLLLFLFNKVSAQNNSWSLEACIDSALKNNLQIKISGLTNDINEKNLEQFYANRIPRVNANASQGLSFGRSIDPTSNQFTVDKVLSNNFGINGSLTLFNGFENKNTIKQYSLNYQAGLYDIEKSKNDILLNVMGFYLQVLLYTEQEESSKMQMQNSIAQLRKSELLFNKGMITEDVYYKIKSQVAADEQNAINIINQLRLARLNLCQAMQIPFSDEFQIEKINVVFDSLDVDQSSPTEIYQTAEKIMPQIKSNDLRLKSSFYNVKTSRAGYFPSLSLNGGISTIYSSQRKEVTMVGGQYIINTMPFNTQLSNNFYQYISLNLSVPIISGKVNKINVARSKINMSRAQVDKELSENQLRMDIETSYASYSAAVKKYNAVKSNLEARKLSYEIIEKRYNAGYLNIYNYLEEKNGLAQAELDFLQSKYEFIFRKKILDFYKGNLKY
jgi:outer membrane protein